MVSHARRTRRASRLTNAQPTASATPLIHRRPIPPSHVTTTPTATHKHPPTTTQVLRLHTALEICICSTGCDAAVFDLLLGWHCRLLGARATFVGPAAAAATTAAPTDDDVEEEKEEEQEQVVSTALVATTAASHAANAKLNSEAVVSDGKRFSTLLHWALKARAAGWLVNVVIETATRYGLAQALCVR
jgi:hypothetical protein